MSTSCTGKLLASDPLTTEKSLLHVGGNSRPQPCREKNANAFNAEGHKCSCAYAKKKKTSIVFLDTHHLHLRPKRLSYQQKHKNALEFSYFDSVQIYDITSALRLPFISPEKTLLKDMKRLMTSFI